MSGDIDPLALVSLGRSGLRVSRVGFGTAPLATYFWENDPDTAAGALAAALTSGISFFDTAPLYGHGESEQRLGRSLPPAREGVVVATKVGRVLEQRADGTTEARQDFSYDGVMRSLAGSLERLGLDHVDIVHVHDPDEHLDEALDGAHRALVDLRDQGVIAAVSVGTNVVDTARTMLDRGDLDCMLVAGRYTLLDQSAAGLIAECHRRGVGFIAAGVFNSGVLASPQPGSWFDYAPASDEVLHRVKAIEQTCARHGASLRRAALNFPLANAGVTAMVVGMATADEVREDLSDVGDGVPPGLWQELADEGFVAAVDVSSKGS